MWGTGVLSGLHLLSVDKVAREIWAEGRRTPAEKYLRPFMKLLNATFYMEITLEKHKIILPDIEYASQNPENLRVVLPGKDTKGHFSIVEQTYSQGENVLPHNHTRESHLVEVLLGRFRFDFPGTEVVLTPRQLINISDGSWHGFSALDDINILRVYIYPAGLEDLFTATKENPEMQKDEINRLVTKFGIER
jgi:quercetin dioxygenase-like cupin family protein